MKIAVIAAQGRSGQAFVQAALLAGHTVNAGIHGDDPFEPRDHLQTHQCDATNKSHLDALIKGCDAVVSMIGHVKGSDALVQTTATKAIASVMQQRGVRRFVSLTGTGARIEGDTPSQIDKLLNIAVANVDPKRVKDGIAHMKVLENTQLDWTIIRVLKLGNGEVGQFTLTEHGPAKLFTPRAEVASAALDVLENNRFIKQAPVISR